MVSVNGVRFLYLSKRKIIVETDYWKTVLDGDTLSVKLRLPVGVYEDRYDIVLRNVDPIDVYQLITRETILVYEKVSLLVEGFGETGFDTRLDGNTLVASKEVGVPDHRAVADVVDLATSILLGTRPGVTTRPLEGRTLLEIILSDLDEVTETMYPHYISDVLRLFEKWYRGKRLVTRKTRDFLSRRRYYGLLSITRETIGKKSIIEDLPFLKPIERFLI